MGRISWQRRKAPYVRGCTIDGVIDLAEWQELLPLLGEVWSAVDEVLATADPEAPAVTVMIEIWPLNGQVVLIVRQRRDLGRIVLDVPRLEQAAYDLSADEPEYEAGHDALLAALIGVFRAGLGAGDCTGAARIEIRSADDTGTEVTLRG